jgi:hypothetical protein
VFHRERAIRVLLGRRFHSCPAQSLICVGVAQNHLGDLRILDTGRDSCHRRKLHDVGRHRIARS